MGGELRRDRVSRSSIAPVSKRTPDAVDRLRRHVTKNGSGGAQAAVVPSAAFDASLRVFPTGRHFMSRGSRHSFSSTVRPTAFSIDGDRTQAGQ